MHHPASGPQAGPTQLRMGTYRGWIPSRGSLAAARLFASSMTGRSPISVSVAVGCPHDGRKVAFNAEAEVRNLASAGPRPTARRIGVARRRRSFEGIPAIMNVGMHQPGTGESPIGPDGAGQNLPPFTHHTAHFGSPSNFQNRS